MVELPFTFHSFTPFAIRWIRGFRLHAGYGIRSSPMILINSKPACVNSKMNAEKVHFTLFLNCSRKKNFAKVEACAELNWAAVCDVHTHCRYTSNSSLVQCMSCRYTLFPQVSPMESWGYSAMDRHRTRLRQVGCISISTVSGGTSAIRDSEWRKRWLPADSWLTGKLSHSAIVKVTGEISHTYTAYM